MHQFCHNCGDQLEEGEFFCDQCGAKIVDPVTLPQANTPMPQPPNTHPSATPPQNFSTPQNFYTPNPIQPQPFNQYPGSAPSSPNKVQKLLLPIVLGLVGLIVILGIGAYFVKPFLDKRNTNNILPTTSADPSTANTTLKTTPLPFASPKATTAIPKTGNQTQNNVKPPAPNNPAGNLANFRANLNAVSYYDPIGQKITVKFQATLTNFGSGPAQNVMLDFSPDANDANASYLGINANTYINLTEIPEISAGDIELIERSFVYSNASPSLATQAYLQDLSNRFIAIPIMVYWEEDETPFKLKLMITK